jgi:methylase of polypeptide subunit release factors
MKKSPFTLIRRSIQAARLGFAFYGTSRTPFPKTVRLCGTKTALSIPQERGPLYDLINVWLDDEYGLRSLTPSPKTIMDVGANAGVFCLWARHCFPKATIHAYEPNPRSIPFLRSNLRGVPVKIFIQA